MNTVIIFKRKKSFKYAPVPKHLRARFKEVSTGKDRKGFFCYTHRCRSDSYPSLEKIPLSVVRFIASTG